MFKRLLKRWIGKKRIVIFYPYDWMNEPSDVMPKQVQTTKSIREVFEQYRKHGLDPKWWNEVRPKPDNKHWACFTGIEIDA